MVSFAELWEQLDKQKAKHSPLMGTGEEEAALSVIKVGEDLHDEGEASFWDEFITVCNNTDGLSQLLGVSREKIRSWPAKIQEMKEKLDKHRVESPMEKEKPKMIPTGDNGAFTTNVDPNLGDMQ